MAEIRFDPSVAEFLLRYARMVVARGYVHNTLGNIAVRVPHPGFEHGVVYTKHAEVSLEDMTLDNVVVTDVEAGRLLHGHIMTSVGHQMNREIMRLRRDIDAVVHVHHDETIAWLAAGGGKRFRVLSLEFPVVVGKPPHIVPSHQDVEQDVAPIKTFIARTNAMLMESHGITALGRTLPEAYHRLNTVVAEVRRNVLATQLAAATGEEVRALDDAAVAWMYDVADRVVYPASRGG